MAEIKEEIDPLDIPDSMEVDEFLIKSEPEDDENNLELDSLEETSENSMVGLDNVQIFKCEPETETDFIANERSSEVNQQTVPPPMFIPKIERDMIDSYITQPDVAASSSIGVIENNIGISDDETYRSVPGSSGYQNRSLKSGRGKPKRTDLSTTFRRLGYMTMPKYCGVLGCGTITDAARSEGVSVFRLPNSIDRRTIWLKQINRMDLLNKPSNAIHICEKHFHKSDIITTTRHKSLKTTAVPSLLLPYERREHKGVQAINIMFDNCTQTDYSNMETKAVQVTSDASGAFNNSEIKKLIAESKKRLKTIENGAHKTQIHAFNNWCNRFLPGQLAEIIKGQAVLKINNRGNRYDLGSKAISLNMFYTSKPAYELLCKSMCLLHSSSLKRMDVPVSTEYNEDIMTALEMKVYNMTEREKYCSVIVDLMKVRASLGYVIKKDRIAGLHDVNGCQSMEPAQYALVLFARGLFVNWTQPIAFALLSENKNPPQVSKWIDMYLIKLLDIGLKIKAFVPTFKSDLFNEALQRSISVDKPYFFVDDIKIYYILDVPDLLKELRDSFLKNKFHFQKENGVGVAEIKYVNDLIEYDLKNKLKLAPKLTQKLLHPEKNQVRPAAQLLSRSAATAIEMLIDFNKVDDEGRDTVNFLLLMNDLFDILNYSSINGKQYKKAFCGDKSQVDLLEKSLEFFQTLQIFTGKRKKMQSEPRFIENFQITIKSVLLLFEDLKQEGHDHLFTRNLHLEVSKKFFKAIKAKVGMVVVPTAKHFLGLFRGLYLTYLLKTPNHSNKSRDLAKFLTKLNETEDKQDEESASTQKEVVLADSPQMILQSVSDATAFFTELRVSEENNIGDVCKILLKGCLKHHKNCEGLKNFVDAFNGAYGLSDNSDWAMHTSGTISPVYFVSFIERMEKEFCAAFEQIQENSNIGTAAYERVKYIEFAPPCPCFPTNYLKGLFIRLRIFIVVQYNTEVYRKNNFEGTHVVNPIVTPSWF